MSAEEARPAFPAKQTIPIERVLAEYGRSELQLKIANETIDRQQAQIAAISKQLQNALAKLASYNESKEAEAPKELTPVSEIKLPKPSDATKEPRAEESRTAQDG